MLDGHLQVGEMMTIRPGWDLIGVIVWSALVGMFIAFAFIWPAQAGTSLTGPVLIGLVAWFWTRCAWSPGPGSPLAARQSGHNAMD